MSIPGKYAFSLVCLLLLVVDPGATTARAKPSAVLVLIAQQDQAIGAQVRINGRVVGRVPIRVKLHAGRYLVEVSKGGFLTFRRWVQLSRRGTRRLEVSLERGKDRGGALLVSSNVVGAELWIDGQRRDTTPALVRDLIAGEHAIELRLVGYRTVTRRALVKQGETVRLHLELSPPAAERPSTGTLIVNVEPTAATVWVDGKKRGTGKKLRIEGLEAGRHRIVVRTGRGPGTQRHLDLGAGEAQEISFDLSSELAASAGDGGALHVQSRPAGATVTVDGSDTGVTPLKQQGLAPGPHVVRLRLDGYREAVRVAEVQLDAPAVLLVALERQQEKVTPTAHPALAAAPRAAPSLRRSASFAAVGIAPGFFAVDAALGYPYVFETRLSAGIVDTGALALDAGVAFRTFGALSEFGAHTRFRFLRHRLFSIAAMFELGAGGGPKSRSTFYSNAGILGSVSIERWAHFSLRSYVNFFTDRLCPGQPEGNELAACGEPPSGLNQTEVRGRIGGARFFLSALLEVVLTKYLNVFAVLEGAPFQADRRIFTADFASLMPESDPGLYGRIGVTLKR